MPGRPYLLAEATWKAVRDIPYQVAVLPWGATEAHNFHLPYGTDTLQCDAIAAEAARLAWEAGAKVAALPTIPFGVQTGQLDIRLTINLNPSTQFAILGDVVDSLARQGVPKLVILNGHGGNDFRQMVRELAPRFPVLVCTLNWWQAYPFREFLADPGDHAGELETSVVMHLAPELVLPLSEAGDGSSRRFRVGALREGWAWTQRHWTQATRDTGVGNPRPASAAKGRLCFEAVTRQIAGFLIELAAADPKNLYE